MKKIIIAAFCLLALTIEAQIYKGKPDVSTVTFFSKSPLEDIEAINKAPIVGLRLETADIQFAVVMSQFKFKSALMEEHFNENYVESEKFPQAVFKGKIVETIDYTKDGEYKATAKGTLNLHGVTKDVEITGTLIKKGNEITLNADFKIKLADYNIKVPSLYVQNIAESVDVKVNAILEPFVKK